ncbi:hypothetical protein [Jiella sonneratiae]|uniref:Uncharacterized protein n=1 Tax=Jiella sonneratiae TaxID=2816856 RepID=A0ABS3IY50_9HYPH|nr:hypothetical protein [Jiella sonneratiae]MBO0902330.1 hypothetical protein [Jiella sonneratiae]
MKIEKRSFHMAALAAGLSVAAAGAAQAAPDYFARFDGAWHGGGSVRVRQLPSAVDVSCDMAGSRRGREAFTLGGDCRAMLFMRRQIAATLRYDPKAKLYTGTYTGSTSGPATLSGRLKGDTLDLKVTWARKIYDDDFARMLIKNTGRGAFTMQVVEKIGGKSVVVSDLAFRGK